MRTVEAKQQDNHRGTLKEKIQLRRAGQYLEISPAVRGLESYFHTVRHVAMPDEQHGVRVEQQPYPMVWEQERLGRPYYQCFAGLEPMVREVLAAQGHDVVAVGERPEKLPQPQLDSLKDKFCIDSPGLDLVRRVDRGLIRYDAGHVEPCELIAQVALAWPKAKIVIVATRIGEAVELRRDLGKLLGKVALFTGEHHPAEGARVVVATPNRLGDGAIALERRNICIALDPEHIFTRPKVGLNEAYLDGIRRMHRARLYGLLADGVFLAPWQRSWLTALFGVEEVYVPRHGQHEIPVDVLFSPIYGGGRPENNKDDVVLKRQGIWHHPLRNRRIAALFGALAGKKTKTLARKFAGVAAHLKGRSWDRVGLLVEGVEHGLALARLLPDVPLVAGAGIWTEGLSPEEIKTIERGKKGKSKRHAIVTVEGLARTPRFDVLIRVDGGKGLLSLPLHHMIVDNDVEPRLLLIDFKDRHHPVLGKWSRRRRSAYLDAGWTMVGRAAPSAMDLFVARRPEVNR